VDRMASFIKTKGIVLSQMPIKDQDKRIVVFSVDYGKMIVFANGARKGKSPLLAGTQPFVFGEFHLVEGRDSYTLKHVEVIETFYALREDLTTLSYALYLLEVVQHVISESDPNEELLRLLYVSLMTLKLKKSGAFSRKTCV
jgi:DNA repair protein RecO (recombination protein O)